MNFFVGGRARLFPYFLNNMQIKSITFYDHGFMTQQWAFGGQHDAEKYDATIKYRSGLYNYLIDTGSEVILVDTGLPVGFPESAPKENAPIYSGRCVQDYMDGFLALGYKPEQVTKILLTHRHADHSGELKSFPNAKIYVNADELDAQELKGLNNIVPVHFTDGAYYNFPESQKIADGIYFIKAKGHTDGNSLIIAENEGLFYMFQGDITYTDEALYLNRLSIFNTAWEDAQVTLDRVREFVANHPTVYLSTHTPLGPENLAAKRVIDLENMPEPLPIDEIVFKAETGKYVCSICGFVYDPAENDGVAFEDLPDDWLCPRCKQPKSRFNPA